MPNEMNDFIKKVCGGFTLSHILAALRGLEDQRNYDSIEEMDLGDLEQHFWEFCGWEFFDEEDRELKIPLNFTHQLKKQKLAIAKLLGYESVTQDN